MADSEILGYCIPCRDNVPVDSSRSCIRDGQITIPPTYGKRTQEWVDGAWVPFIPRPEGYVWTPPALPEPKPPAPPKPLGTSGPQTRTRAPRSRASSAYLRQAKKIQKQPIMVTLTCEACKTEVTRRFTGGRQQRFCSMKCRNKTRGPRPAGKRNTPMSALGLRCSDCGRDDVPHRAKGMCPVCSQRARRRAMREAAA
jgi:endogenous inhibitor of DNA gyrase (YacG/DUF329 family)